MMHIEQSLVIIKPDGILKSLTGNIISRISELRLTIIGAKVVVVNKELAEEHYAELRDKPFFPELISYIMGEVHDTRRVLALVYRGENSIKRIREVVGATNPEEAAPYSIRGGFGRITTNGMIENVVHASSCTEDAEKEIKLWFKPHELIEYLYPTKDVVKNEIHEVEWE